MEDTKPVLLRHKEHFKEILKDYQVSDRARNVLASTPFVVLCGLAGGGRNTVIRYLVENANYVFDISDTTRPPKLRDGHMEQDGVNYYFRSEEAMLRDIQRGEYIEAELIHDQQVSGISIREIERIAAMERIPIRDIEYGGAESIFRAKQDASIITLLPPSYDVWIQRFREREEIHHDEFHNRLRTAVKVLERTLERPYFTIVINDTIEECASQIREIVERHIYSDTTRQAREDIAKNILAKARKELLA